VKLRAFRDVEDVRIFAVHRIAFRPALHAIAQQAHSLLKLVFLDGTGPLRVEILAERVRRKRDGAAGVFFLAEPEEVGGEADLALHLLLAVAVIVVGNQGDDDAAPVAADQLECAAVVVRLAFLPPAHAVAPLPLGGLIEMRKPQFLLPDAHNMGSQNHTAGVSGPMQDVQRGIVFRQIGIAAVAEDGLHEIQIADQIARREEANLHGLGRVCPGGRANHGPQQQRYEQAGLLVLIGGERQSGGFRRRVEGLGEKLGESRPWDG